MEIALRPDLQLFIEEKIRDGQYASPNEVLEEALMVLREQERSSPADLDELRRELRIAIEASDRGETAPWSADEIKAEGRKLMEARQQQR